MGGFLLEVFFLPWDSSPDPINHAKYFHGPACRFALWELVTNGSKNFRLIVFIRQKSMTQSGWTIQRVQVLMHC